MLAPEPTVTAAQTEIGYAIVASPIALWPVSSRSIAPTLNGTPTPAQSPSCEQAFGDRSHGAGRTGAPAATSAQLAAFGPHTPAPLVGALHCWAEDAQRAQSPPVVQPPTASRPQLATQTPFALHALPAGHGEVVEHCAHVPAWHACAGEPVEPQALQSSSFAHFEGHSGTQPSATQRSFVWQAPTRLEVHATQLRVVTSQTRWRGSQAAQSRSVAHVTVGSPFASLGHVSPARAHSPKLVHPLPDVQGVLVSHATQRCAAGSQIV